MILLQIDSTDMFFINFSDFNSFGSIASVLGLILSFIILYKINEIRKEYKSKILLPKRHEDLTKYLSELSNKLASFNKNKEECIDLLNRCKAVLVDIQKYLGKEKKEISKILSDINNLNFHNIEYKNIYNIYSELNYILKTIEIQIENINWS